MDFTGLAPNRLQFSTQEYGFLLFVVFCDIIKNGIFFANMQYKNPSASYVSVHTLPLKDPPMRLSPILFSLLEIKLIEIEIFKYMYQQMVLPTFTDVLG